MLAVARDVGSIVYFDYTMINLDFYRHSSSPYL
jgi:hypothetical protein